MVVYNHLMYVTVNLHVLCSKICIVRSFENLLTEFSRDQFASSNSKRRNFYATIRCIKKIVTLLISRNRHGETRVAVIGLCSFASNFKHIIDVILMWEYNTDENLKQDYRLHASFKIAVSFAGV